MVDNAGEGVYQNLRSLLRLITGELSLEKYIDEEIPRGDDIDKRRIDQLSETSQSHEKSHSDAWMRYGIKFYYVLHQGYAGTVPDKDSLIAYIKESSVDIEGFRKILLEVVTAPTVLGTTDEWMAKILRNEYKTLSDFAQAFEAAQK